MGINIFIELTWAMQPSFSSGLWFSCPPAPTAPGPACWCVASTLCMQLPMVTPHRCGSRCDHYSRSPQQQRRVNSACAARCRAASTVHRGRTDRINQLRLRRPSSRTQAHSRYHKYYCLRYGQELVQMEVAIQGRKILPK